MGAGLGGGAILGGSLISFVGIRAAYQLFAGLAFLILIVYNVLSRLGNEDDDDDDEEESEVRYQGVSIEEPEDTIMK